MNKFEDIYNSIMLERELPEEEIKGEIEGTSKEDGIKIIIEYFRSNEVCDMESLKGIFKEADIPVEKCEIIVIDMLKSFWAGGTLIEKLREDNKIVETFIQEQLTKGVKVEMKEHFSQGYVSKKMAEKIAMDHLAENTKFAYYDELEKMESN